MDFFLLTSTVIVIVAIILLAFITSLWLNSPDLPGPSFLDQFNGGLTNEIIKDRRKYLSVLMRLSQEYGDVFRVWLGCRCVIVTNVREDAVHILTSREDFERINSVVKAFNLLARGSLFTMSREKHLAARKILKNSLHHAMMKDFHPAMQDAVKELSDDLGKLVDDIPRGHPSKMFDVSEMLSAVTMRVILNVAFGAELTREQRVQYAKNLDNVTKQLFPEILWYPVYGWLAPFGTRKKLMMHRKFLRSLLGEIVRKRKMETEKEKSQRSRDFLDSIIEVEGNDVEALVSQAVFLSSAGSHTTNVVMSWCLYNIAINPDVASKIYVELDSISDAEKTPFSFDDISKMVYLKKVWKETLRLHPISGMTTRRAVRYVVLKGSRTKIKKDSTVGILFLQRHKDEKSWTQPENFLPDRWGTPENPGEGDTVPAGTYLPFSVGVRDCVGQTLANHEAILVLSELLRRYKFVLACDVNEVISTSGVVQMGRYASKRDGMLDMGIPMRVELR